MQRLFPFVILAFSALGLFAQGRTYHITIPDGIPDTIDVGMVSPNVTLEVHQIWVHNPTDDTMVYGIGSGWGVGYGSLKFLFSDSDLSAIIPPHDSIRAYAEFYRGVFITYAVMYAKLHEPLSDTIVELVNGFSSEHLWGYDIELFEDQYIWHELYWPDPFNDGKYTIPIDSMVCRNVQDSVVTISAVFIPKASKFTIRKFSQPLPAVLHKDETFTVFFSYPTPDTFAYIDPFGHDTVYRDLVVIVTDTSYKDPSFHGVPPKRDFRSAVKTPISITGQMYCYPNPATDEVILVTDESERQSDIDIVTSSGAVMETIHSHIPAGGLRIPLSGLPGGLYLIRAGNRRTSFIKRW